MTISDYIIWQRHFGSAQVIVDQYFFDAPVRKPHVKKDFAPRADAWVEDAPGQSIIVFVIFLLRLLLQDLRTYLQFRFVNQNLELLGNRHHLAFLVLLYSLGNRICENTRINVVNVVSQSEVGLKDYKTTVVPLVVQRLVIKKLVLTDVLFRFVHLALEGCKIDYEIFILIY